MIYLQLVRHFNTSNQLHKVNMIFNIRLINFIIILVFICAQNCLSQFGLIVNGGFETNGVCMNATPTNNPNAINGWTVINDGTSSNCDAYLGGPTCGMGVYSGNYAVDLQSSSNGTGSACAGSFSIDVGIEQNVPTVSGRTYILTFYATAQSGGISGTDLEVKLNNTTFQSIDLTGTFSKYSYTFTATGNTTIRFANKSISSNTFVTGLDNISVITKEDCSNGIDDDGDGHIDCEDADCAVECYSCTYQTQPGYAFVTPEPGYNRALRINFSGYDQNFVVPTDVTEVNFKAWGAGGGGNDMSPINSNLGHGVGGPGGYVEASTNVNAGDNFSLMIGEKGSQNNQIYGYGGGGYWNIPFVAGGSGGGLTGVFTGSGAILESDASRAVIIAGGGGGGNNINSTPQHGGSGGDPVNSGGQTSFHGINGINDDNHSAGGGGGYNGGGEHNRTSQQPMYNHHGGNGGSSYAAASTTNTVLNFTPEFNSVAPNTLDPHYLQGIAVGEESTLAGNGQLIIQWHQPGQKYYDTLDDCIINDTNLYSMVSFNDTTGIWQGPSPLSNNYLGTYSTSINSTGTYIYIGCTDTMEITVSLAASSTSVDSIIGCNLEQISLYDSITKSKNNSGTWQGPSTLAGNHLGVFDKNINPNGWYYYINSCNDTAKVYVENKNTNISNFTIRPTENTLEYEIVNLSQNYDTSFWKIGDSITLNFSDTVINFVHEGNYKICNITIQNGCFDSLCQEITIEDPVFVYMPNAFTPDVNSINDEFHPIFSHPDRIENYELLIYDRWGHIIFNSTFVDNHWNGLHNNQRVQSGIYVWKLTYKIQNGIIIHQNIGHVTVIH